MALYAALVVAIIGFILVATHLLGQRHRQKSTGAPYESGLNPTGSARGPFGVNFYLVAMFFVIFDLEAAFLVVYAAVVRETGWQGFAAAGVFAGVLLAALAYLWRQGGLDWVQRRGRRTPRPPGDGSCGSS